MESNQINGTLSGSNTGTGQPDQSCSQISGCSPQAAQQTGGAGLIGHIHATPPSVRVSLDVAATASFSAALMHLRNGGKAARAGWNGPGQHVFAQWPDCHSKMSAPYLALYNGRTVPWVPSQGDLFANDWALLPVGGADKNAI